MTRAMRSGNCTNKHEQSKLKRRMQRHAGNSTATHLPMQPRGNSERVITTHVIHVP